MKINHNSNRQRLSDQWNIIFLFLLFGGFGSFVLAQVTPADSKSVADTSKKTILAKPAIVKDSANQKKASGAKPVEQATQVEATDTTAKSTSQSFNDAISKAAESMAPGLTVPVVSQENNSGNRWPLTGTQVFWAVVFFGIAFIIIRYLTRALETIAERWTNLRLLIKRLVPMIRILGWTLAIFMIIAGILQPPIETLIAFTASAGIAIGFASQDILKNVFGGLMILLDRPFQVGDKIEASGHYGEVVQIGLRTVRLVTPDDNLVSVPNGEIMNQPVSNANAGESNCQVVAEFFLPAGIDIQQAEKIAYRAAAVSRYVYLNKPIAVIFKNEIHENRSLLKMRLKAYVLDIRYEFPFASEMTRIVLSEFLEAGIVTADQMEHFSAARSAKQKTV